MQTIEKKITVETTYQTQDGNVFGNENEAIRHERYLTLLEVLEQNNCDLDSDVRAALHMLATDFDVVLGKMYNRKVLSKIYGRREDF